jgi:hypothetical protein
MGARLVGRTFIDGQLIDYFYFINMCINIDRPNVTVTTGRLYSNWLIAVENVCRRGIQICNQNCSSSSRTKVMDVQSEVTVSPNLEDY